MISTQRWTAALRMMTLVALVIAATALYAGAIWHGYKQGFYDGFRNYYQPEPVRPAWALPTAKESKSDAQPD